MEPMFIECLLCDLSLETSDSTAGPHASVSCTFPPCESPASCCVDHPPVVLTSNQRVLVGFLRRASDPCSQLANCSSNSLLPGWPRHTVSQPTPPPSSVLLPQGQPPGVGHSAPDSASIPPPAHLTACGSGPAQLFLGLFTISARRPPSNPFLRIQ